MAPQGFHHLVDFALVDWLGCRAIESVGGVARCGATATGGGTGFSGFLARLRRLVALPALALAVVTLALLRQIGDELVQIRDNLVLHRTCQLCGAWFSTGARLCQ